MWWSVDSEIDYLGGSGDGWLFGGVFVYWFWIGMWVDEGIYGRCRF